LFPPSRAATNLLFVGYLTNGLNIYTLYTNTYLVTGEAAQMPQKNVLDRGDPIRAGPSGGGSAGCAGKIRL